MDVDSIIFDFDGVLVDTAEDLATAANVVLEHYGMPPAPLDLVRANIGGGAEPLMHRLLAQGGKVPFGAAMDLFKGTYGRCYDVHSTPYPGVRETLDLLLSAGKRMAIATNKVENLTTALIRKLGLDPYFLLVVGPESVMHRKPDPEAIDLILRRLGMAAGRTLMIGDTPADILAGRAAGVLTCGVLYGYGAPTEIENASPDFVIRSMGELPETLLPAIAPRSGRGPASRR